VLASLAAADLRPDLVISDFHLSDGKTGIDMIGRVRTAFAAPIPAFLVTGDIAPERLRDARAMRLQLLHKPVGPMALRAMLNQLLKGSGDTCNTLQTTMARGSATNRQAAANPNPVHPLQ
jgi:CheY-like chemotaxis protein